MSPVAMTSPAGSAAGAGFGSPTAGTTPKGGGARKPRAHTTARTHRNFTVLDTSARTKNSSLSDPADKVRRRQELRQQMKWRELNILHEWLTTGPDRTPNMEDLDQLKVELRKAAAEVGEDSACLSFKEKGSGDARLCLTQTPPPFPSTPHFLLGRQSEPGPVLGHHERAALAVGQLQPPVFVV